MTAPLLFGLCLLGIACGPQSAAPAQGSPGTPAEASTGAATAEAQGSITCAEQVHDFGQVWEGARLFHEFVLEVSGEGEQQIHAAKGTCGCT